MIQQIFPFHLYIAILSGKEFTTRSSHEAFSRKATGRYFYQTAEYIVR